jgi:hypothetical protein
MNTNSFPAFGTGPPYFFIPHEFPQAKFLDVFKILDHAHIVFGPVSFIQMFQIIAGKVFTLETKPGFPVLKNLTVLDFTSNAGNGFVGINASAAGACIFFSQICHANTTVHSAWRDKRDSI